MWKNCLPTRQICFAILLPTRSFVIFCRSVLCFSLLSIHAVYCQEHLAWECQWEMTAKCFRLIHDWLFRDDGDTKEVALEKLLEEESLVWATLEGNLIVATDLTAQSFDGAFIETKSAAFITVITSPTTQSWNSADNKATQFHICRGAWSSSSMVLWAIVLALTAKEFHSSCSHGCEAFRNRKQKKT